MPEDILITLTYKRTVQHVQYEPQDVGLSITFPLKQLTPDNITRAVAAAVSGYQQLQEAGDGLLVEALATGKIARPEGGIVGPMQVGATKAALRHFDPVGSGYQPTPGPVRPSVPPRKP